MMILWIITAIIDIGLQWWWFVKGGRKPSVGRAKLTVEQFAKGVTAAAAADDDDDDDDDH